MSDPLVRFVALCAAAAVIFIGAYKWRGDDNVVWPLYLGGALAACGAVLLVWHGFTTPHP